MLPHPACLPYFLRQSSWFGTHQIGRPASQPQQSAVCPSAVCCLSHQHWVIAAVLFPAFRVGTKLRCPCLCLKPFVNRAISSALTSVVGILLSCLCVCSREGWKGPGSRSLCSGSQLLYFPGEVRMRPLSVVLAYPLFIFSNKQDPSLTHGRGFLASLSVGRLSDNNTTGKWRGV